MKKEKKYLGERFELSLFALLEMIVFCVMLSQFYDSSHVVNLEERFSFRGVLEIICVAFICLGLYYMIKTVFVKDIEEKFRMQEKVLIFFFLASLLFFFTNWYICKRMDCSNRGCKRWGIIPIICSLCFIPMYLSRGKDFYLEKESEEIDENEEIE